jgi:hypothetical protein
MTKTTLFGNTTLALVSVLFFATLIPILDFFVHPFSVIYGDYFPLIVRLSDVYWTTGFLSVSSIAVPLLLLGLTLLTQGRRLGFGRSIAILVAPFSLALIIQYFIAVQLDKELRSAWSGHSIQWNYIFQFPFMTDCFFVLLGYAAFVALLWFTIWTIWRATTRALTRRCSELRRKEG